MRVVWAGCLYFGIVFAIGFVLGTIRTLYVKGTAGADPLLAVMVELPIMLFASWVVAGWLIRLFHLGGRVVERLAMGGIGFLLLMAGEVALGLVLFGQTVEMQMALAVEPSRLLGLLGQLGFGVIPVFVPNGKTVSSRDQD